MAAKLRTLMEIEGYDDLVAFLIDNGTDSVCPGICVNNGCDFTTEVEPDQDRGHCEVCGTQTVKSALVLAGLI
jgi:hypothetical protein